MSKLPTTLHGALRASVEDAQKLEATGKYYLNMSEWHLPRRTDTKKKCQVCMAGALMVSRLDVPDDAYANPTGMQLDGVNTPFSMEAHDILDAVNEMRIGDVYTAFHCVYERELTYQELDVVEVCGRIIRGEYEEPPGRAPWEVYLNVAARLKEVGL